MRTELKNAYFKTKADQLNFASEQRDTEQEFRLMKQHTSMQVPVKCLTASITCLYNKGRKSLAENYRGLSIIATVSKVVSVIVMERISEVYEHILMPSQFGFRANRSTIDAIKSPRLVSILRALYTGTKAYVKGSSTLLTHW